MIAVILAGGLGTRLSEETTLRPKPLVEVGGRPLLWHIMKTYSHYGINDFIICCGYKGHLIKEYFINYLSHMTDVRVSMSSKEITVLRSVVEPWNITMLDTGDDTMTGGRILRASPFLKEGEPFCVTYGDGLINLDIGKLVDEHVRRGLQITVTAVRPVARFGALAINSNSLVTAFTEKQNSSDTWINGGYFVVQPEALARITGDDCVWEESPLSSAAKDGQLAAYLHEGFWQPVDTLREKNILNDLWASGNPPWKVWK